MDRAAKITTAACVLVVGGLVALSVPAVAAIGEVAHGTATGVGNIAKSLEPVEFEPEVEQVGPTGTAWVNLGPVTVPAGGGITGCTGTDFALIENGQLLGKLVDNGPREHASGEVLYGTKGQIAAYIVAPNDSMLAIGERFCIPDAHVFYQNSLHMQTGPHPGQTLVLDPQASIESGAAADAYASCDEFAGFIPADHVEGTFNGLEPFALVDTGPRPGANGSVGADGNGNPMAYAVAEGDDMRSIAERFCIGSNPEVLDQLNSIRRTSLYSSEGKTPATVHPGDTLNLSPYTVASVGDEQGVVHNFPPKFELPAQR